MDELNKSIQTSWARCKIFLAATLVAFALMRWLSKGLSSEAIVAFELAKTEGVARQILSGWDAAARANFLWSVYADYLLLIGYGGFLFYASKCAAIWSAQPVLKSAGAFFAWLAPLAALMDGLENTGMLFTINRAINPSVVHFTYDMAVAKFSLLFIVGLFVAVCLMMRFLSTLTSRRSPFT